MSILPELPHNLPAEFQSDLLNWSSDWLYARLAQQDPHNRWLRLAATVDFTAVEAACAGYHKRPSGDNVPHSTPHLVRALFVKHLLGISLRATEEQISHNLMIRRFVGYGLHERVCDHSTLERFEVWVAANAPRSYFDSVLRTVDRHFGASERAKTQYADTFAMHANAAPQGLVELLRQTCSRLVAAAATDNACQAEDLWRQLDRVQLLGPDDERHWWHLTADERTAQLHNTVCGALACRALVTALPNCETPTRERLEQLNKILDDEVTIADAADGQPAAVKRRPAGKRGSYRIASAVDPAATWREHGADDPVLGYNISVATTDEFVREIHADTGATADAEGLPALLTAQQAHHDHLPAKLVYDKAAGAGKTIGEVDRVSGGRTQLVVELRDYAGRSKLFAPRDFTYDLQACTLTCPNGVTSTRFYRSGSGDGWTVRFLRDADGCAACPLLAKCYEKPQTQEKRDVFISDNMRFAVLALLYMTSDGFRAEMRQRSHVERIIAALVRYNDARHARRRGRAAADFQVKMAGMAYNVKKLLRKLEQPAS